MIRACVCVWRSCMALQWLLLSSTKFGEQAKALSIAYSVIDRNGKRKRTRKENRLQPVTSFFVEFLRGTLHDHCATDGGLGSEFAISHCLLQRVQQGDLVCWTSVVIAQNAFKIWIQDQIQIQRCRTPQEGSTHLAQRLCHVAMFVYQGTGSSPVLCTFGRNCVTGGPCGMSKHQLFPMHQTLKQPCVFLLSCRPWFSQFQPVIAHSVLQDPFNLLSTDTPQTAADIGWFSEIDAGAVLWGIGCSPGAVVAVHWQRWESLVGFEKKIWGLRTQKGIHMNPWKSVLVKIYCIRPHRLRLENCRDQDFCGFGLGLYAKHQNDSCWNFHYKKLGLEACTKHIFHPNWVWSMVLGTRRHL